MKTQKPERKDWVLFIYIIPIAVLLLFFVGQWAMKLLPFWSVNAGMNSNLEPDSGAAHPFALLEPLLPQILIPLPWAETYLDPNGDFSFPPFLTFEPTASPAPTAVTATPTEATPTATAVPTETPTATSIVGTLPTDSGGGGEEETPTATATSPATCNDSNATNNGGPLPCTYPPATCTDPLANNQGQPLPCTFDPICPGAHNPDGPLPCDYGNVSTPPVGVIQDTSPDPNVGINTPPDEAVGEIADGTYIYLSLNVTVSATPDNNYDLVFYEWNNGGFVFMDLIIIGIATDTSGNYYEVFNWGNNIADTNSNVEDQAAGGEGADEGIAVSDNNEVPVTAPEDVLYDPDHDPGNPPGIPETNGPLPQTGILIDVDQNTGGNPPPGVYNYVIIISPPTSDLLPGGGDGGNADVDTIQAVEVPIPTP